MQKKQKILFINNFFTPYGGAENAMMQISNLLSDEFDIEYFALDKQPFFIENYKYLNYFPHYQNAKEISIFNPAQIIKTFYNTEAKGNLSKLIDEIKPDFAFIHNIHYNLTTSVIDICHEKKIPTVLMLHDPRYFCPGGTLSFNDKYCDKEFCIKGNPINCIKNRCKLNSAKGSLLAALEFWLNRKSKALSKTDKIICPSSAMKDLAVRANVAKEKLSVINHFISQEMQKIEPDYTTIKNSDYFLFVGRLSKEKGVHYLIEAVKQLPDTIKIHIVGDGDKDYIKELNDIVAANNLNNIIFKGSMTGNELAEEYKNCIATLLPCNWFETFGLTVIESFAHGKPVIASKIGALPEIIQNNENGLLVEPTDINGLSEAIQYLLNNRDKAIEFAKNGKEKVKTTYSASIFKEKFKKVLDSINFN